MSREQRLEEKLRKSQSLSQKEVYRDFITYAKEVRDEIQVYEYMQEHQIGIDEWEYWLSRFEIMKTRCQFVKLVKLIKKLKNQNRTIQPSLISNYEKKLIEKMQKMYFRHIKGKRSAKQFNNKFYDLHPKTRKIGNIQVYVDQSYRHHYDAEDLSCWIQNHMQDECEAQRNQYEQYQERKPLSFIAKKQQHLIDLTKQLYGRNSRKSMGDRNSIGSYRLSNKINLPQNTNLEAANYNTPKNNDQNQSNFNIQKSDIDQKNLKKSTKRVQSSRDSIQILKSIHKQKMQKSLTPKSPKFKSPKFKSSFDKFIDQSEPIYEVSVPEQKCRSVITQEQHMFSFGKSKSEKKNHFCKTFEPTKDNAFLFHSFSQQSKFTQKINTNFVQKQDFMLQLMIKQIQRQAYEITQIKTFSSQIGSNQQNQIENQGKIEDYSDKRQKKRFEVLMETESQQMKNFDNLQLQKLIDFDEDKISSSSGCYLSEGCEDPESIRGNGNENIFCKFMSENKKRLSNISQQSNFQSQSKRKHHFYK